MKNTIISFLFAVVCFAFCSCSPNESVSRNPAAKASQLKISDRRILHAIEGARLSLKNYPKFSKFIAYISVSTYAESPETFFFHELKNIKNWEPDALIPYCVDISVSLQSDGKDNDFGRFSFVLREGANGIFSISSKNLFPRKKDFEFVFGGGQIESVNADKRILKTEWVCVFTAGEK